MGNIAIFRINYKSDFILTLNSDAGWLTPFCIKFWTGAPIQAYFVGFDGTTYTHCAPVDGEPTKLRVQFDDHHLPIGDLKFQIGYHFTVADFPTSVEDEVLNQASVIIEVDDAPAQVMLDFNGETAPEIEFSLPAYANEAQRIANEEQRIAAEQQRIANEDARIQAEETRQQNEQQRINHETARVNEFATLKSQSQAATRDANAAATLANEKAKLAADKAALAQAAATLANEKSQLAADKAALAAAAATLANDKATLAQQKAAYAQAQGDYAKAQGDYAKAQGDTAQADHERAEADHTTAATDHQTAAADHTTAASDHSRAEADHTTASSDHTRAESDHSTASADHTTSTNDHTQAVTDHSNATSDHAQAGSDHTRAESDHTRAESDHAAVEVYVDSLGAFDISAYNATGGVLAKYADLSAALGTDGANIPEAIRKGGMSVKFVQSSDNKYVQYMLTKDEWSVNVVDWEKTNLEDEYKSLEQQSNNNEFNLFYDGFLSTGFVKDSYVQENTGAFINYTGWSRTNYVNIAPFSQIKITALHASVCGAVYNKNKERIQRLSLINGTFILDVTEEMYYIAVSDENQYIHNVTFEITGYKSAYAAKEIEYTKLNYEAGKQINQNGILVNGTADASKFIKYTSGESVTWKFSSGSTINGYLVFYDSNRQPISGAYWQGFGTDGQRTISALDIQQYAPNAAYLRASFEMNYQGAKVVIGSYEWTKGEDRFGLKPRIEALEQSEAETKNNITEIQQNITEIEQQLSSTQTSTALSSIASKTGGQNNKKLHNYLCLIHQSDIHGDADRMQRMIVFANKYKDRIDGIISTGDFSQSEWSNTGFETTYVATLPSCEIPHFPLIGNHDIGLAYTIQNNSNEAAGARFITPYMEQLGAVQGGTNAGYYYKDFSTYKIRMIVLNEYEMPRVPNAGNTELKYSIWKRYISQAQATWFVNTLSSVQDGWSVIVAMHQLIDVFDKYDNEFKGTVNYTNADVTQGLGNILQDIVDAYISKNTLSQTYTVSDTDPSEVPSVNVNADFTTAHGEFICWINGHTHNDGTGQSSIATNKQVDINVTTGSANVATQAIYDDLYREANTPAQDAFNVVCFDTDRKEIRMLRIGANVNNQMKRRDYACISYAQS